MIPSRRASTREPLPPRQKADILAATLAAPIFIVVTLTLGCSIQGIGIGAESGWRGVLISLSYLPAVLFMVFLFGSLLSLVVALCLLPVNIVIVRLLSRRLLVLAGRDGRWLQRGRWCKAGGAVGLLIACLVNVVIECWPIESLRVGDGAPLWRVCGTVGAVVAGWKAMGLWWRNAVRS